MWEKGISLPRAQQKPALLISACLVGHFCRYDGGTCPLPEAFKRQLEDRFDLIPFCPEEEGGLSTPRVPAEIQGGTGADVLTGKARVLNRNGEDVTAAYLRGAQKAAATVRKERITVAVLKARSPACGPGQIYDGSFSGRLKPGDGVTAAMLRTLKVRIFSEEDLLELISE